MPDTLTAAGAAAAFLLGLFAGLGWHLAGALVRRLIK